MRGWDTERPTVVVAPERPAIRSIPGSSLDTNFMRVAPPPPPPVEDDADEWLPGADRPKKRRVTKPPSPPSSAAYEAYASRVSYSRFRPPHEVWASEFAKFQDAKTDADRITQLKRLRYLILGNQGLPGGLQLTAIITRCSHVKAKATLTGGWKTDTEVAYMDMIRSIPGVNPLLANNPPSGAALPSTIHRT